MFKRLAEILGKLIDARGATGLLEAYILANKPQSNADVDRLVAEFYRQPGRRFG